MERRQAETRALAPAAMDERVILRTAAAGDTIRRTTPDPLPKPRMTFRKSDRCERRSEARAELSLGGPPPEPRTPPLSREDGTIQSISPRRGPFPETGSSVLPLKTEKSPSTYESTLFARFVSRGPLLPLSTRVIGGL